MTQIRDLLLPLYKRPYVHSIVKAITPRRYHGSVRHLFQASGETQWCRIVMNRNIESFISSLDCPNIDALEISGTGSQDRYNFRSYRAVQYPEYDVCEGVLEPERFDLIIAEQVFEHILRPDKAASNVLQMLRPGGTFVISTPFLLKVHGAPLDLYRWTEVGIRQLLETAGFTVTNTGSWGNRDCLLADLTPDMRWTPYDARIHSLHNEPLFPIVVWAFARRENNARSADR